MSHRTFDDVIVGETIDCGTNAVTRAEITSFAGEYDPLAIHVDAEAATASPFGGLIASGIHTFGLTQPPVVDHFYGDSDLIAAGRMEELWFPAPVRPGDTLHVTLEIEDKRVSETNDERGVVTARRTATVDDELVLSLRNHTIWRR
ncbi:MaoC/PaaZ C-terminal domain-containing protein [Halosolutus amylolyticus]|uniref:MaoC/PaaZ C-terminal domain-containing protein n=1 Tax=Halosolutus amylolyticus TaxID=2932267 RepID=A0ABD5PRR5_9EURY|nr:MaoC/PaaZ C-terminal domain-containing protein [Halosolutus amylolyticus]